MQNLIGILLILLVLSCKHLDVTQIERDTLEESIINPQLINNLNSLIETKDSLSKLDLIFSEHNSYWIFFHESEEKCYVSILANFNFYDKENLDGFLKYRGKVITFYNTESSCNRGIVNSSLINIKEDEIENIVNYDDAIIPPHEPEIFLFEINENGKLIETTPLESM